MMHFLNELQFTTTLTATAHSLSINCWYKKFVCVCIYVISSDTHYTLYFEWSSTFLVDIYIGDTWGVQAYLGVYICVCVVLFS